MIDGIQSPLSPIESVESVTPNSKCENLGATFNLTKDRAISFGNYVNQNDPVDEISSTQKELLVLAEEARSLMESPASFIIKP